MKRFLKFLLVVGLVAATAGITFCITYQELSAAYLSAPVTAKVNEIGQYLDYYFIDDYSETELANGAAAGMIAATGDEWSYYISAEDYMQYEEQMNNAYVGIGVTIQADADAGGFEITSVTPGSPAESAGVLAGDILTKVGDDSVLALGQSETVNRVRGEAGSSVAMTFSRNGIPYEVTIIRASITTEVARLEMTDDGIGVITITNFDNRCADETIEAIDSAVEQGAKAIVFDVRNNPGGLKSEMVAILDRLLPEGVLFRSINYAGEEEIDRSDAACLELPMAVVVNRESYSAAEFFAAALQEYDAAIIVGTQTYGKGNFQSPFRLSDGSAISISVGKYFTPNGVSLTGIGVTPDQVVELGDEESSLLHYGELPMESDPQMQAALAAVR